MEESHSILNVPIEQSKSPSNIIRKSFHHFMKADCDSQKESKRNQTETQKQKNSFTQESDPSNYFFSMTTAVP